MAADDLVRRSFEAGTEFLGMTRERAEAFVKELVKRGDVSKKKAQQAVDDLLDRSRQATDHLRQIIGSEIGQQLSALGLATRDDLARLERRIEEMAAAAAPAGSPAALPTPDGGEDGPGPPPEEGPAPGWAAGG